MPGRGLLHFKGSLARGRILDAALRYRDCNARRVLLAPLLFVGCSVSKVPEIYHGHVGRTVLAVPSRVASSVLYNGESDWTASERPKAERTNRDPIQSIEFYVDLDHPNMTVTDQAARDRLSERSGELHLPSIVGHVIGITVDFPEAVQSTAAAWRSQLSSGKPYPGAFQALEPALPEYGLETRRADWSKPVEGRERHGNSIFDVDVDYLGRTENIYLYCNDARQVVAPFAPMPTCQFRIIVPEMGGRISGSLDRGDVPRWRDLRSAALATLHSFVAVPR